MPGLRPVLGPRFLDTLERGSRPTSAFRLRRPPPKRRSGARCARRSRRTRTTSTSRTGIRARSRCPPGTPSSATSPASTTACPSTCGGGGRRTTPASSSSSPRWPGARPTNSSSPATPPSRWARSSTASTSSRATRQSCAIRTTGRCWSSSASSRAAGASSAWRSRCRCTRATTRRSSTRTRAPSRRARSSCSLSHMINITGQILPVRKIADMAHARGVAVIVDAAHSFAQLVFTVPDLDGDYLGASLHKWLCTPLGAGLLHVKKDRIRTVWPLLGETSVPDDDIRKLERIGTHPVWTIMAIADAIRFHTLIGGARKEARLRYLQQYWTDRVREIPNVRLNTPHGRAGVRHRQRRDRRPEAGRPGGCPAGEVPHLHGGDRHRAGEGRSRDAAPLHHHGGTRCAREGDRRTRPGIARDVARKRRHDQTEALSSEPRSAPLLAVTLLRRPAGAGPAPSRVVADRRRARRLRRVHGDSQERRAHRRRPRLDGRCHDVRADRRRGGPRGEGRASASTF